MTDENMPDDARRPDDVEDAAGDVPGDESPDIAGYEAIQDDDARTGENYYEEMIDTTGPFIEGGDDVDTGAGRSRPRD